MEIYPDLYTASIKDGYKQNIKKYFPWFSYYLTYMLILIVPFNKLYNRIKKRLKKLSFLVYSG